MNIENIQMDDLEELLAIWKTQKGVFGIPFRDGIYKLINSKQFLCIKDNGKMIAICAYKIMKRNPSVQISHLWVHEDYRRQHIATKLISHIINLTKDLDLKYIVRCKDGAENNKFYNAICEPNYEIEHRETLDVRSYVINKDCIDKYIEDKNVKREVA